jgi:nucleoside-diphosphate-sugar epimerase
MNIQTQATVRIALVLGATGSFGSEMAAELIAHGWQVRALQRDPVAARLQLPDLPVTWVDGDAMIAGDVARAAEGVKLIVHAVNPPRYQRWRELALPMLDHSIAAAKAQDARLVFPGVVYNYGPDAGEVVDEQAPQHPLTRKGKVRLEMEDRLADSGVKTLTVRAGDFFGGRGVNAWFNHIFKGGQPLRSMMYPGAHDVLHEWAYLPDMVRAVVRLVEREQDLQNFERFHFSGYQLTGREFIDAVRTVTGNANLAARSLPWFLIAMAAPFASLPRELLEMRYLWQRQLLLNGDRLNSLLGNFERTPMLDALRNSLTAMDCLSTAYAIPH